MVDPVNVEEPVVPLSFVEYADQLSYTLKLPVLYTIDVDDDPNVLPLKSSLIDISPELGTEVPSVNVAPRNSDKDIFVDPGSEPPA